MVESVFFCWGEELLSREFKDSALGRRASTIRDVEMHPGKDHFLARRKSFDAVQDGRMLRIFGIVGVEIEVKDLLLAVGVFAPGLVVRIFGDLKDGDVARMATAIWTQGRAHHAGFVLRSLEHGVYPVEGQKIHFGRRRLSSDHGRDADSRQDGEEAPCEHRLKATFHS